MTSKIPRKYKFNKERKNSKYIKHIVTPALGSISNENPERKIGYFRITPDGFKEVILRRFVLEE